MEGKLGKHKNKADITILISDKTDFKQKILLAIKKATTNAKNSIYQDNITLNLHLSVCTVSNYIKQKNQELQGEIDKTIIRVRDFKIPCLLSR